MNPVSVGSASGSSDSARELTATDFHAFFRDVHGHDPFPWQQRLTEEVLASGNWPGVIDLPTGTGKTAVLDTAVFALAAQPDSSPRRVVFVIDRRIVVDQVYERARKIQTRLREGDTRCLRTIGERLRALSDAREVLGVAALRGGIPIENEWARRPDQPWIMVSTVDQFGSRLLFRGYGVGPRMRPIHAGLAGNDCLVILDEVHLSIPFAETLAHVASLQPKTLPRRFKVVEMSATPSDQNAKRFCLDQVADLMQCEELRRRVEAEKKAELVSVRDPDAIPNAILRLLDRVAKLESAVAVQSLGVVVNRVRTARETHQALVDRGYSAHLITGRMRPLDRSATLADIASAVDPDGERSAKGLTIIVATQAIEVGADFSFDALITECAAIDSLRQRFGRLDRRGRLSQSGAARAWIIGPKSVVTSKQPDPIYGEATRVTWEELQRLGEAGLIDVGSDFLQDFPAEASAPKAEAPLLLRSHMDAWVQTSPEPLVQPPLDWFLHGMERERNANPDVSIVWRRDRSIETLTLVPPRQAEFLQVPIGAAKSWLAGSSESEVEVSDAGNASFRDSQSSAWNGTVVEVWEGVGNGVCEVGMDEVKPGDVILVPPCKGGLAAGTWDPSSTDPVEDLGDAAQWAYGRRRTLRLDPRLPGTEGVPLPKDEVEADSTARERIQHWLNDQRTLPRDEPDWRSEIIEVLCTDGRFEAVPVGVKEEGEERSYYILVERAAGKMSRVVEAAVIDGFDESASGTGTGTTLGDHLRGVGERAASVAQRLGLATELVGDLRLAGSLHDLGKVDKRFQFQLVGGDPIALEMLDEPLAKSLPGARWSRHYPKGMRHEVASVALAMSNPDIFADAHDRDLVLHLVGTHHGFGRPLPPILKDLEPQKLEWQVGLHVLKASSDFADTGLALDMADRFWRLVRRYGQYGLAWLEAILRLADHQQSAEEGRRQ